MSTRWRFLRSAGSLSGTLVAESVLYTAAMVMIVVVCCCGRVAKPWVQRSNFFSPERSHMTAEMQRGQATTRVAFPTLWRRQSTGKAAGEGRQGQLRRVRDGSAVNAQENAQSALRASQGPRE